MSAAVNTKEPVTELIHGIEVADQYRWLEDPDSPWTNAWLTGQKTRFESYFADLPHLSSLRARLKDYLNVSVLDQAVRTPSRLIYRCRKPHREQASIYVQDAATGVERILVDSSLQDPFTSFSIYRASDDGAMVAYGVREGGSDTKAIRVIDVTSGEVLPFVLPAGSARGFAFAQDINGVFYCHDQPQTSPEHLVRFHSFRRPLADDPIVFALKRTAHSRLLLISDHVHLGVVHRHEHGSAIVVDLYLATYEPTPQWRRVLGNKHTPANPLLKSGRVFVLAGMNGLPTSITEFTTDGRLIGSVVPESSIPVSQVELTGDAFYTTTPVDDKTYVHRWCLNSNEVEVVDIPQDRAIQLHSVLNNTSTSLFLTYESFVTPSCFVEYRPGVGATCLSQGSLPTPMENHPCVQRRTYPSRDKTEISISIVSSNLGRNTATPILLSAYGGFGVSVTPQFSVLANILIENGACFAIPEVRGGSEKGPEWHDAARGINRQRAFDDFIAAAEWLCQQGLTSPHRLAICGGSNAGLLVGAVMTQRPELFRAVLCIAPLLDMVRYEQFDNAKRWIKEFGTVSSPSDFAALLSYSPYHRIKDDVNYPATLFVTGAKDERCNPAHVRKTAARLQDRPAQHHPILVDHTPQRGHAPTMPLSIRIEALAVRLAFLCNELGIAPGRPQ